MRIRIIERVVLILAVVPPTIISTIAVSAFELVVTYIVVIARPVHCNAVIPPAVLVYRRTLFVVVVVIVVIIDR